MKIILENVGVKFPIYDAKHKSFKKTLINAAGGVIRQTTPNSIPEIESLSNISFSLKQGDRLALIGHNGSGKTTLLRVLAGVYQPTQGNILVEGKITSLLDSMLGMDPELSGLENLKLRGIFLGLKKNQINQIIEEVIDFSELGGFIDMPVRTYSSGMVLRLAFSISTAIQPEIILMDEWMSVGDESFKQKAENRLKSFIDKAVILVMATHDHDLADRVCNLKIHLEHGKILY